MNFPQYRKYRNGKSYFKIISASELIELKISGGFYEIYVLQAKILPDRNLIMDLLEGKSAFCEVIGEEEYEEQLGFCEKNLRLIKG